MGAKVGTEEELAVLLSGTLVFIALCISLSSLGCILPSNIIRASMSEIVWQYAGPTYPLLPDDLLAPPLPVPLPLPPPRPLRQHCDCGQDDERIEEPLVCMDGN